jgi:hypothetical protein
MSSTISSAQAAENYNRNLFNGTFYQNIPVSENVYSIVYSFFFDKTKLKESADALTQSLLTLSYNSNVNPIDIIQEFVKAPNDSDYKKLLISVFNTGKPNTSRVGFSNGTTINRWVSRNIVA